MYYAHQSMSSHHFGVTKESVKSWARASRETVWKWIGGIMPLVDAARRGAFVAATANPIYRSP
jgi:hypothetical protein